MLIILQSILDDLNFHGTLKKVQVIIEFLSCRDFFIPKNFERLRYSKD